MPVQLEEGNARLSSLLHVCDQLGDLARLSILPMPSIINHSISQFYCSRSIEEEKCHIAYLFEIRRSEGFLGHDLGEHLLIKKTLLFRTERAMNEPAHYNNHKCRDFCP